MNCKQGDLAVIIRSAAGNAGMIVEVLRPLGVEPVWRGIRWDAGASRDNFCWLVRSCGRPLATFHGVYYTECPIPDVVLKPIRDQLGEDEMLCVAARTQRILEKA